MMTMNKAQKELLWAAREHVRFLLAAGPPEIPGLAASLLALGDAVNKVDLEWSETFRWTAIPVATDTLEERNE